MELLALERLSEEGKGKGPGGAGKNAGKYCSPPGLPCPPCSGSVSYALGVAGAEAATPELVKFITPALAAPVCDMPANPLDTKAAILTIMPLLFLLIDCLITSFDIVYVPVKFVLITAFHPLLLISVAEAGN